MSPPKFQLQLSEKAKLDFRDILSYTMQTWGDRQLIEYRGAVNIALKRIEENPDVGVRRERLLPGFRSLQAGSHVIFYRVDETSIHVARTLHGRMDFARHLDE